MKRAFTLIEMAIVLVIVGLLIGGGIKVLKMQREKEKTVEAKQNVKAAKDAVIGNALINDNTLPPAAFFQSSLSPVKSTQHPLLYVADSTLESYNACAFNTTALKVQTPTTTIDNVAFVIAAEGANYNMQTAVTTSGGNSIVKVYDYSTKVDDNTSPINRPEEYDDIVEWVTLSQLQKELQCSTKPLRFVNNSLPTGMVGQSYSATLYVENNITSVTITCSPTTQNGITFSSPNFSGTPANAETDLWSCTVSEASPSTRSVTKQFVLTVNTDPTSGGGSGGGSFGGNRGRR